MNTKTKTRTPKKMDITFTIENMDSIVESSFDFMKVLMKDGYSMKEALDQVIMDVIIDQYVEDTYPDYGKNTTEITYKGDKRIVEINLEKWSSIMKDW